MQVLIVDDDIATVDAIKKRTDWESLGVDYVYTAYNINQAKELILIKEIDVIISDIEMPKGSGIEFLEWYRRQELDGEVLFLTCHDNFGYAANAVKLKAAEYLLKPFDVQIMEAALKKIIYELKEKRRVQEESAYGQWIKDNPVKQKNRLLNDLLMAQIPPQKGQVIEEISRRKIDMRVDPSQKSCRLVVSKVMDKAKIHEKVNANLAKFILENIHAEMLCLDADNAMVDCFEFRDYYIVATVCEKKSELAETCTAMIESFRELLETDTTCCIGRFCHVWELYEKYRSLLEIIDENVSYFGTAFYEEDGVVNEDGEQAAVMDSDKLERLLDERKKLGFLSCIKQELGERMKDHSLSVQTLRKVRHEILQSVYTYLGKKDISAGGLNDDASLNRLEERAVQSMTDLIRWVNCLLERLFSYEDDIKNSYQLSRKVDEYIRIHYMEPISRNEIAAHFYMTPKYLSKIYKEQTGVRMIDAITSCRISQAKILLKKGERVSDVATAVGFENFTYFSTIFKKYTGMTPNQYRKNE